jgi:hypothetical protein
MNLSDLPADSLERLARYQQARDEERQRIMAVLSKEPSERTPTEERLIAYSEFGTASGCGY